jgi:hypothetical protein
MVALWPKYEGLFSCEYKAEFSKQINIIAPIYFLAIYFCSPGCCFYKGEGRKLPALVLNHCEAMQLPIYHEWLHFLFKISNLFPAKMRYSS